MSEQTTGNWLVSDNLNSLVRQKIALIMDQREGILEAFIAKYGVDPCRMAQVEQKMPDGTTQWYVRKITDDEMLIANTPNDNHQLEQKRK